MTRDDLLAFEEDMAARFNAGEIRAPLHLAGGNEDPLRDTFTHIRRQDWVLCGWRSHYHCLLKGMPAATLRAKILEGRSIALCSSEYKILSSAIVGGICPIAVGLAWSIKRKWDATDHVNGDMDRVWCFIGDMTRRAGVVQECIEYSAGHDLPVTWVIEDNGVSVCTNTDEVWGRERNGTNMKITSYDYTLTRPHVGTGKFVSF